MRTFDKCVQNMLIEPVSFYEFRSKLKKIKELQDYDFDDIAETLANLKILGISFVELSNNLISLESNFTPIEKQKFCIVDIEASGNKPTTGQIIEIGAVIVENGKIIDKLETFVKTDEIPENISTLTHIRLEDVKDAPSLKSVLERFRLFLSDAVFVAHNVNFDYNFISASMEKVGFGPLLNRKMCTIDLSQKCIDAPRYGLGYLIKELGIDVLQHHRAYSDAYAAKIVFDKCLEKIPSNIITTEDLVKFTKPNPKKRKKPKA